MPMEQLSYARALVISFGCKFPNPIPILDAEAELG
jgi:hypothetical protein